MPLKHLTKNFLVMIGAMAVAVELRLVLSYGEALGTNYQPQSWSLYFILFMALAITYGLAYFAQKISFASQLLSIQRHFRIIVIASFLSTGLGLLLLPNISKLQWLYYLILCIVFGLWVVAWVGRLKVDNNEPLYQQMKELKDAQSLILIWLRYKIVARYSQTILGLFWIVLLPLLTTLVMAFVFGTILDVNYGDAPRVAFIFSAIVPWGLFSQGSSTSTGSVLNQTNIITRTYFPREILVLVTFGEAAVDLMIKIGVLILVNMYYGIYPTTGYFYLPIILIILHLLTLGVMFYISCLTVFIRDTPQLVGVILQLLFYLIPIIYPIERVPQKVLLAIYINPLAAPIQEFRDIMLFNQRPDWYALQYSLVIAIIILYTGYAFFKANEYRMADLV